MEVEVGFDQFYFFHSRATISKALQLLESYYNVKYTVNCPEKMARWLHVELTPPSKLL